MDYLLKFVFSPRAGICCLVNLQNMSPRLQDRLTHLSTKYFFPHLEFHGDGFPTKHLTPDEIKD